MYLTAKHWHPLPFFFTWEVCNERNEHVFRNKHIPIFVLLANITKKARLWVIAGAKKLIKFMPREYAYVFWTLINLLVSILINQLGQSFCPLFKKENSR
jgi:hypothetical protein